MPLSTQRRTHFAVDQLSEEGRQIVHDRAGKNWTLAGIVAELQLITGEEISDSSLSRYLSSKAAKDRIEEAVKLRIREEVVQSGKMADAFCEAVKNGDFETAEVGRALIQEAIFAQRLKFQDADPLELTKAEQNQQKLDIDKEKNALKKREIEFNERKMAALEAKQKAIEEAALKAKQRVALNPEEAARQIDEIYGLAKN